MADSPAAERTVDEEGVRALLRAAAPELADRSLELVAEGWDNAIWRLGSDLAVRVPRRALAAPLIAHEQQALRVLGPRLARRGIRTPTPLVMGRPVEGFPWPWSVVPWIDGTNALTTPRSHTGALAEPLAAALIALHREAPGDAPANPVRGVPLAHRDAALREHLEVLGGRHDLREAWEDGLAASPSTERVWIHGDLHPGNILIDHGHLVALIDFGDVTAGDPAYDLAVGWLLFDAHGRDLFRSATGARYDAATWTRARAWAAYLTAVLLARSDDRPQFQELGETTARELARS